MLCLKLRDRLLALERNPNVVEPLKQAAASERIDRKIYAATLAHPDFLAF